MSEPAIRILVNEAESRTVRSLPRWFMATIRVLAVGFLLVSAVYLMSLNDSSIASPNTAVVDVYITDDAGSEGLKQVVDRLGAERTVLDWRVLQPWRFRQTRMLPIECDQIVSVRLLVADFRDAKAISQLVFEWYSSPGSLVSEISIRHGGMGIPVHCPVASSRLQ